MRQFTDLKIVEQYPPNILDIDMVFGDTKEYKPCFCFGKVLYNPYKREILPDVELHEATHSSQQGDYPEVWWYKYLNDTEFRKSQEVDAYGVQYQFASKLTRGKLREYVLDQLAYSLSSSLYGKIYTYGEARSKIRNYK